MIEVMNFFCDALEDTTDGVDVLKNKVRKMERLGRTMCNTQQRNLQHTKCFKR